MFTGFKALSAYNVFLEVGIETGVIGLIVFMLMLIIHFTRSLLVIIQQKTKFENKIILVGVCAGLLGLFSQGMVDTVWYRTQVQIVFWLMMAIITSVVEKSSHESTEP